MTIEELKNILTKVGVSKVNVDIYSPILIEKWLKYGIVDKNDKLRFLANCLIESGNFKTLVENLNYSASGLLKIFKKYFNTETANKYARKPEQIANIVYANRGGNTLPNSGWKYRGRGLIQTTFYGNYLNFKNKTGIDVINNPDLLIQPEYAVESACLFWKDNNISKVSDIVKVRKIVNGGTNGLKEVSELYSKLLEI